MMNVYSLGCAIGTVKPHLLSFASGSENNNSRENELKERSDLSVKSNRNASHKHSPIIVLCATDTDRRNQLKKKNLNNVTYSRFA
jgi:hypothetical protein